MPGTPQLNVAKTFIGLYANSRTYAGYDARRVFHSDADTRVCTRASLRRVSVSCQPRWETHSVRDGWLLSVG